MESCCQCGGGDCAHSGPCGVCLAHAIRQHPNPTYEGSLGFLGGITSPLSGLNQTIDLAPILARLDRLERHSVTIINALRLILDAIGQKVDA